jgi:hypothetical protein
MFEPGDTVKIICTKGWDEKYSSLFLNRKGFISKNEVGGLSFYIKECSLPALVSVDDEQFKHNKTLLLENSNSYKSRF